MLRKQIELIEENYADNLEKWDGDVSSFESCNTNLVKILMESTVKDRSEVV